jgi:hypothetical protein
MKIDFSEIDGIKIAEIISDQILIHETQDALDLMAEVRYLGSDSMILFDINLNPDFFNLKTRLAGEILQKFSNYRMRLAIVGDFSKYQSRSLKDFISESNRTGRVSFADSIEEARTRLAKQ